MIDIEEFQRHLKNEAVSDKTVSSYVSGMKHYSRYFDEVTTENVKEYKRLSLSENKPQTVNLRLNAIARYAKWKSIKLDIGFVRIQEPLFAENLIDLKDYKRILKYLKEKGQTDWYCAFRLLACTGVRVSESHQIVVGDLRHTHKIILGKGTKTRVVWIPLKFREEVQPLLQNHMDNEPIVPWSDDYIRTKLRALKRRLRLKVACNPHTFRKLFARQVYAKTKDIHLVKDLLGHTNIQTTMRYLKVTPQSIGRRMSRIVDW